MVTKKGYRASHVLSLPKGHQARKERPLFISPNLRDLCAFARDTFFRLLLHPQNFKYLWLVFNHFAPAETRCPRIIASGSRKLSKI